MTDLWGDLADDGTYDMIMDLTRKGCCETWPKPCQYHEGFADGLETGLRYGVNHEWDLVEEQPGLRRYRRRT